jgi:hypothetical protein
LLGTQTTHDALHVHNGGQRPRKSVLRLTFGN